MAIITRKVPPAPARPQNHALIVPDDHRPQSKPLRGAATPRTLQLGPVTASAARDEPDRIAAMIWGQSNCGKTTFAATAPGTKLWLSMGDNEHVSVTHRSDVIVAKLYGLGLDELFRTLQSDSPLDLDSTLKANPDIQTVVFDSATALAFRALQKSVKDGVGASRKDNFVPSMEVPGRSAYGGRNNIMLECLTGLLRVTARHERHFIITAHESDPTMKIEQGREVIDYIGVMLGGQLVNNMTWRLSEIWHMQQSTGKRAERYLTVKQFGFRKTMKTRMFKPGSVPRFELHYDADQPDSVKGQMTIAGWHEQWLKGGRKKLALPGPAADDKSQEQR